MPPLSVREPGLPQQRNGGRRRNWSQRREWDERKEIWEPKGKGKRMAGKENEDWNRYLLRKIWFRTDWVIL